MIKATICFFTHFLLVFLEEGMMVHISSFLTPHSVKITNFIDESAGKINQFAAHSGDLECYLKLQGKDI